MIFRVVVNSSEAVSRTLKVVVRGNPLMEVDQLSPSSHQYDFEVDGRGELFVQVGDRRAVLNLDEHPDFEQLDFDVFSVVFNPQSVSFPENVPTSTFVLPEEEEEEEDDDDQLSTTESFDFN